MGKQGSESSALTGRGVHPRESFAIVVRQERSRVQRFGGCFTLLTIALSAHAAETAWLQTFVSSVHRRLRAMDAFGWIGTETLGVVLPVTGLDGAWTVARDLERIAKGTGVPLSCTVMRFPEEPDDAKGGARKQESTNRRPARRRSAH
jgi:hypothetical protein